MKRPEPTAINSDTAHRSLPASRTVRNWRVGGLAVAVVAGWGTFTAFSASEKENRLAVEAELFARKTLIQMGQPVWVECLIRNSLDEPATLVSGDASEALPADGAMGLPLEHVFSGEVGESLIVRAESDTRPARVASPMLPAAGRTVVVAPHATVGRRIDLSRYCDLLRRPGTYEIQWRPYRGTLQSNKLRITVAPLRQAVIHTDFGKMTMRFYYDQAPQHVQNFVELAEKGFYDGLTFHRVVHGGLIQGGCPRGDGTGVRPDGKLLKAELSDLPLDVGSVVMATARNDPDSASTQFYICLTRLRNLDGKQTVFGYLTGEESFETLRKIGSVPTGDQDRPIKPVYIRNISLDNIPAEEDTRIGGTRTRLGGGHSSTTKPAPAPLPTIGPPTGPSSVPGASTQPTNTPPPGGRVSAAGDARR